jgi:hypothetical protein
MVLLMMMLLGCAEKENTVAVILSPSLQGRRAELQGYMDLARENIRVFAQSNGWGDLTREAFMDSVMIFDDKALFNRTLLKLAGEDSTLELPDTYCAALEKRVLIVMSPEYYAKVYPEGVEEQSYVRLLTHEIAHRLHIRILNGDEEAMGPIWFYEGFAIYAANQFSQSNLELSKEEMIMVMQNPERGSYVQYNFIFRYFARRTPVQELIEKAKEKTFNDVLIDTLNQVP